jgi:glyoxalase family protein
MLNQIKGLHHVTSFAVDAQGNNVFFTEVLGLRRVKKTVNFDAPDIYHLYFGNENGTPGSLMTYFPFPHIAAGRPGTGEVGRTDFSIPKGALNYWRARLATSGVVGLSEDTFFGSKRLHFKGVDGDNLALVEQDVDDRAPYLGGGIGNAEAIRGIRSVSLHLRDDGATKELLKLMGYETIEIIGGIQRFGVKSGNGANFVDIKMFPHVDAGQPGSGSVHHVAFAVENREKQLEVQEVLLNSGFEVTPVIDRNYFWSIYFRTPGGVLFEIATQEPGFDVDEDCKHLGESLKLPYQHEHLRQTLEKSLQPISSRI